MNKANNYWKRELGNETSDTAGYFFTLIKIFS